jgi:hypothetical protein
MAMFGIAIITAPRKINYLPNSVAALRAAGFNEKIFICAEPLSPIQPFENVQSLIHHQTLGRADNWLFALNLLLKNTKDDWLIVAEDDICCKINTKVILERFIQKIDYPIGYISCFTSESYFIKEIYSGQKKNWIEFNPGMRAYGNQFYVMQRQSAQLLLDESKNYFKEFPEYKKEKRGVDFIVSTFFEKKGLPCFYPIPNLVDHMANAIYQGYLY